MCILLQWASTCMVTSTHLIDVSWGLTSRANLAFEGPGSLSVACCTLTSMHACGHTVLDVCPWFPEGRAAFSELASLGWGTLVLGALCPGACRRALSCGLAAWRRLLGQVEKKGEEGNDSELFCQVLLCAAVGSLHCIDAHCAAKDMRAALAVVLHPFSFRLLGPLDRHAGLLLLQATACRK